MLLDRRSATVPAALCAIGVAASSLWPLGSARAQATSGAAAASAPTAELSPAERAKRDGDKVFHWILIHGDKTRKPAAAAKEDKPVATAAPTAVAPVRPKPAARPAAPVEEPLFPAVAPAPLAAAVPSATTRPLDVAPEPAPPPVAPPTAAPPVESSQTELLKPLSQPEPQFPAALVRTLRSAQVQVKFTVMPDGSVADPSVVSSSHPRLNPSALEAVAQWRFAPLRKAQQGIVDLRLDNTQ